MILFKNGDIFESKCEAIVNTVNTKGVMGKGLALEFKKRFPQNFIAYKKACIENKVTVGKIFIFDNGLFENTRYIFNFPTKDHYKAKSKIEYIQDGLLDMIRKIKELNIKSIAIPPLGCGLGGLEWNKVKKVIIDYCENLNDSIDFIIYEPIEVVEVTNLTENSTISNFVQKENYSKISKLQATMLLCVKNYLEVYKLDSISVLEVHLLCFFLQYFGVNLNLKFSEYNKYPYSSKINNVLTSLNNKYILLDTNKTTIDCDDTLVVNIDEFKHTEIQIDYCLAIIKIFELLNIFNNRTKFQIVSKIIFFIYREKNKKDKLDLQTIKKELMINDNYLDDIIITAINYII